MIKYKNKLHKDYIDLLYYMIRENCLNEKSFPHSKFFYIRSVLENKFKRKFTVQQIKQMITEELALHNIKMI